MLHELPDGKLQVYLVDLSSLSADRFDEVYNLLNRSAYSLKCVPGKQVLKVYWNLVEPIADLIGCPPESVHPCP